MASAATAASELKRAVARFIAVAGGDKRQADAVAKARELQSALRGARQQDQGPTPGQRAAGIQPDTKGGGNGGPPQAFSPKDRARAAFGGSSSSAKGADDNPPPFQKRQRMKRGATARKGS
jgi:hypothetical protein